MGSIDGKTVQRYLFSKGVFTGLIDGIVGPRSLNAISNFLRAAGVDATNWTEPRKRVAIEQLILKDGGFYLGVVDGFYGPNTADALERFQNHIVDMPVFRAAPVGVPKWPLQNQKDLIKFFGQPNTRQVKCKPAYSMRLAWDTSQVVTQFSCHELVVDDFEFVFSETLKHYGINAVKLMGLDLFGGCLNYRQKRGGSSLSLHSWGIAVDLDPERNPFRATSKKATMAAPQFDTFWEIVESRGLVSLGKERNFDWMHFQAARLS